MSDLRRYALAVLLTAVALALALLGGNTWGTAIARSLFLASVMASSWLCGLGPGILATVLGIAAADYFLIAPIHAINIDAPRLVQTAAFISVAALISSLNSSRRSALATIRRDRERLEELVAARTADLGRTNQQLQQLVHDLGERVKELTALHAVSEILEDRTASRADLLARVVRELPPAWQYPEVTEARIIVGSLEVCTPRFEPTPWLQRIAFNTADGQPGTIEVVYRERRPSVAEGPFLREERNLLELVAGMLHAAFDRADAERQRLRAEAEGLAAQQANAAKDQFLATLSHELRSPLNVMLGWTQMLQSAQLSPDAAARGFEVLERSVRLQTSLIDDLLDVSRIVAGKIRLDRHRVDIAAIACAAVDAARPAARAKRIALTDTVAPLLFVDGDPQRLQQVISNLLTNALKFTPDHGRIHLALTGDDAWARLVVRDTGIGIAADVLPRIFERFAQGNVAVPSRTSGGLGLGLAIVKYFVEQHGGAITAESAGPGHGATFTFTLPLSAEAAPATVAAPVAERIDRRLLSGVRVLVVDDVSDDRATLGAILEQFGATPTMVGSAREAIQAIERNAPDVLLSDLAMPQENGFALIRRVRATLDAGQLPAAAVSARTDGESRARALDSGFQLCLAKPLEPLHLARAVAALARHEIA